MGNSGASVCGAGNRYGSHAFFISIHQRRRGEPGGNGKNMKKRICSSLAALVLFCAAAVAQVFVIERTGNVTLTFNDLKEAVDALVDGDNLYIPAGQHNLSAYNWYGYDDAGTYSGYLFIDKKVNIYGAGYANGANSTVLTNGTLLLGKHAGGSTVSGIKFEALCLVDNIDCQISRCQFKKELRLVGTEAKNTVSVYECELYSNTRTVTRLHPSSSNDYGYGPKVCFSKCIFQGGGGIDLYTSTFSHCLFLCGGVGCAMDSYTTIVDSSLSDNIFVVATSDTRKKYTNSNMSRCTFSNNMWVGGYAELDAAQNNTFTGEIDRVDYQNVFVDPAKYDYHLQDGCVGKNAATDGTDVGIFGTATPFKESKLPATPHFSIDVVGLETDANGNLPVKIKIEAQEY